MDYSMGIVSSILVLVIFFPFFYAGFLGSNNIKKRKKLFDHEVAKGGYQLANQDFWGNTFVGLDPQKAKLIYMRVTDAGLVKKEIPLKSIKNCNVVQETIRQRKDGQVKNHLMKVDLELTFKNSYQPITFLNFFDSAGYCMEEGELDRAEKWKSLILSHRTDFFRPLRSAA